MDFAWTGVRGSEISNTVTLAPIYENEPVSVKAYYSEGGASYPAAMQPTVTKTGTTVFIVYSGEKTRALQTKTYITISTGGTVRYAGTLTVGYTMPNLPNVTPISMPTVTVASVQGLPEALGLKADASALPGKLDAVVSTSAAATLAAQTGSTKLIVQIIDSKITLLLYSPTATPTLQKILAYN